MSSDQQNLARLLAGDNTAWSAFVERYAGLILSAVHRVIGLQGDAEDAAQDVFVRLCKDDFRLLRQYDPTRAGLGTWLTIVARSVAHDGIRRRRAPTVPIDDAPESALAVQPPVLPEKLKIPPDLLSPRQQLVLTMLYDQDMDVAEISTILKVDAQTVRSTHHKAMLKLRAHFKESGER
ncbi:MAG TPA: sigma-70 family RNA polymerase sigma factor [Stellaceae bacterium]|nr:sigma-70 family RNA polymerase sigma factor [Stellaceae bacterium]